MTVEQLLKIFQSLRPDTQVYVTSRTGVEVYEVGSVNVEYPFTTDGELCINICLDTEDDE